MSAVFGTRVRRVGLGAAALGLVGLVAWQLVPEAAGPRVVDRIDGSEAAFSVDRERFGLDRLGTAQTGPTFLSFEQAFARAMLAVDSVLLEREARSGETPAEALDRLVARAGGPPSVDEAEIAAWYQAHRSSYVHPRQARLEWIRVTPGADATADERLVRSLYVQAQLDLASSGGSTNAADLPTPIGTESGRVARGRTLVPCSARASEAPLPADVLERGCALRRGALSAPVSSERGWFLIRKTGDLPARHVSLAQASEEIRRLLEQELLEQERSDALRALRKDADIRLSRSVLMTRVAAPPAGPGLRAAGVRGPPRPPGARALSTEAPRAGSREGGS